MSFQIPMFLGDKTETDSYEFAEYMKAAIAGDSANLAKMNDEFSSKFPGYREAARAAQRAVQEITGENSTHLEHKNQHFRAKNPKGMSSWRKVGEEQYGRVNPCTAQDTFDPGIEHPETD